MHKFSPQFLVVESHEGIPIPRGYHHHGRVGVHIDEKKHMAIACISVIPRCVDFLEDSCGVQHHLVGTSRGILTLHTTKQWLFQTNVMEYQLLLPAETNKSPLSIKGKISFWDGPFADVSFRECIMFKL